MENTQTICSTNSRFHTFGNTIFMGPKHGTSKNVSILMVGMGGAFRHLEVTGRPMKIPFRINDTPPQKSGPKGRRQKAGGFSASGPSGRIFEGGLKGNCKKKYIMEVKTVKTRKSTEWCKNPSKSATIWNQTVSAPLKPPAFCLRPFGPDF